MKSIVINSPYAFIYLNKQVYSKKAIEKTLNDFKDFVEPSIKEFGNYITLRFEDKNQGHSLETICREFLNYLCGVQFQMGVNN